MCDTSYAVVYGLYRHTRERYVKVKRALICRLSYKQLEEVITFRRSNYLPHGPDVGYTFVSGCGRA
jgi:hypothetical protein